MNCRPISPITWKLYFAVVLFAARAALGYATYTDRAGGESPAESGTYSLTCSAFID
ncbi:MAG: hypothetical protein GXY44_01380 [Phycisphaerales bacterium]|nr:hypothetical protein [Phycisphaerales bacterium]